MLPHGAAYSVVGQPQMPRFSCQPPSLPERNTTKQYFVQMINKIVYHFRLIGKNTQIKYKTSKKLRCRSDSKAGCPMLPIENLFFDFPVGYPLVQKSDGQFLIGVFNDGNLLNIKVSHHVERFL